MFNKIKAIKDLRDKAKHMQSVLGEIHCEGTACSGQVTVNIDGNQQVEKIHIDPAMFSDVTRLENGIKDALNDAMKKLHKEMAGKMKDMGGLDALKDFGL